MLRCWPFGGAGELPPRAGGAGAELVEVLDVTGGGGRCFGADEVTVVCVVVGRSVERTVERVVVLVEALPVEGRLAAGWVAVAVGVVAVPVGVGGSIAGAVRAGVVTVAVTTGATMVTLGTVVVGASCVPSRWLAARACAAVRRGAHGATAR